jgi:hypothetical protein
MSDIAGSAGNIQNAHDLEFAAESARWQNACPWRILANPRSIAANPAAGTAIVQELASSRFV